MPATSVIGWKHACSCYALFCYWMSMLLRKKAEYYKVKESLWDLFHI